MSDEERSTWEARGRLGMSGGEAGAKGGDVYDAFRRGQLSSDIHSGTNYTGYFPENDKQVDGAAAGAGLSGILLVIALLYFFGSPLFEAYWIAHTYPSLIYEISPDFAARIGIGYVSSQHSGIDFLSPGTFLLYYFSTLIICVLISRIWYIRWLYVGILTLFVFGLGADGTISGVMAGIWIASILTFRFLVPIRGSNKKSIQKRKPASQPGRTFRIMCYSVLAAIVWVISWYGMVAIPHALEAKVIYPSCTIFEKAVAVEGYTRHVIGNYPMYGGTPRLYNAIGSCGDHGEQILIDHDRLSENLNIFGSYFEKRSSKEFTWNVYEHPAATEVNEPCDPPVKVNLNDEAQIKRLLAADIRLRRLDGTCYSTKTPPYFDPN